MLKATLLKCVIIILVLFSIASICRATDVDYFNIWWYENGDYKYMSYISPGSNVTINRDSGSRVDIRIFQNSPNECRDFFYADNNNGGGDIIESCTSYYTFSDCVGPNDTRVYAGIEDLSDALSLYVYNIVPEDPDLVVSHITVDSSISPETYRVGDTVEVECIVWNNGDAEADSSNLGYYIGTSSSDTSNRWESDSVPTLNSGSGSPEDETYTFQASDVGTRYFVFMADRYDNVDEGENEDNNISYFGPFNVICDAPGKPANPIPANGASDVAVDGQIHWANGGGADSYDVYSGTDPSPDSGEFLGNTTNTYFPIGALSHSTTYYWTIDAKNSCETTTGNIWHYTTAPMATYEVSGQVQSRRWPYDGVPGVTVQADTGQSTTTDNLGNYVVSDVPYGSRTITASRQDYWATGTEDAASFIVEVNGDLAGVNFSDFACKGTALASISVDKEMVLPGDNFNVTVTLQNTNYALSNVRAYLDLSFDDEKVTVGNPTGSGWTSLDTYPVGSTIHGVDSAGNWSTFSSTEPLISAFHEGTFYHNGTFSFTLPMTVKPTATSGTIEFKYRGTIGDERDPDASGSGTLDQQGLNVKTFSVTVGAENPEITDVQFDDQADILTIYYSAPIDPSSLDLHQVILDQGEEGFSYLFGNWQWSDNNTILTFTPAAALSPGTLRIILGGARSPNGTFVPEGLLSYDFGEVFVVEDPAEPLTRKWAVIKLPEDKRVGVYATAPAEAPLSTFTAEFPEEYVQSFHLAENAASDTPILSKSDYLAGHFPAVFKTMLNRMPNPGYSQWGVRVNADGATSWIPDTMWGLWQINWKHDSGDRKTAYYNAVVNVLRLLDFPIDVEFTAVERDGGSFRMPELPNGLGDLVASLARKAIDHTFSGNRTIWEVLGESPKNWADLTLVDSLKILKEAKKNGFNLFPELIDLEAAARLEKASDIAEWTSFGVDILGDMSRELAIRSYLSGSELAASRLALLRRSYDAALQYEPELDPQILSAIDDVEAEVQHEFDLFYDTLISFGAALGSWDTLVGVIDIINDADLFTHLPFVGAKLAAHVKYHTLLGTVNTSGGHIIASAISSAATLYGEFAEMREIRHSLAAHMTLYNVLNRLNIMPWNNGIADFAEYADLHDQTLLLNYLVFKLCMDFLEHNNVAPEDWASTLVSIGLAAIHYHEDAGMGLVGPVFKLVNDIGSFLDGVVWSDSLAEIQDAADTVKTDCQSYVDRSLSLFKESQGSTEREGFLDDAYLATSYVPVEPPQPDPPELGVAFLDDVEINLGEAKDLAVTVTGLMQGESYTLTLVDPPDFATLSGNVLHLITDDPQQLGQHTFGLRVDTNFERTALVDVVVNVVSALPIVLTSGDSVSGTVALNKWVYYVIEGTTSCAEMEVLLSGLSADMDLYLKHNDPPTAEEYDCRPFLGGNSEEVCTITNPEPGEWYIGVYGYQAGNYTLTATFTPIPCIPPTITSSPPTTCNLGETYTYDVEATGNPAPKYRLLVYPSGMTINQTTGQISWAPGSADIYDVTVEAWSFEGEDNQSFSITVEEIDSDNDGLPDDIETNSCTDPNNADTDNDGIMDGNEDADKDGTVDPDESDPCLADTDDDGIYDGTEVGLTAPETPDTDLSAGFFLADADPSTTTDPNDADSDKDLIPDGVEDINKNGRVDEWEPDPNWQTNDVIPDLDDDGDVDGKDLAAFAALFDPFSYQGKLTTFAAVMGLSGFPLDSDGDGVLDDGDFSGSADDNPCIGGDTLLCDDNCPFTYNPDQSDLDGNGIGDACEQVNVLFTEDWESGIIDSAKWDLGGSPLPVLASPGYNSSYALHHNGDSWCHSAAHTVPWFDTSNGISAEFWFKPYECPDCNASTLMAGFTEMQLTDNQYCGGENWYDLIARVQHSEKLQQIYCTAVGLGTIYSEDLLDSDWHKYRISIDSNGYVSFYKDGIHKITSASPIDLSTYTSTKFQVYGQASYGEMLIDDITITGP